MYYYPCPWVYGVFVYYISDQWSLAGMGKSNHRYKESISLYRWVKYVFVFKYADLAKYTIVYLYLYLYPANSNSLIIAT